MSDPTGAAPDAGADEAIDAVDHQQPPADSSDTGPVPAAVDDAQTVIIPPAKPEVPRYTAPGFDANSTEMIVPVSDDPKTEFIAPVAAASATKKAATPQAIAPRKEANRSWGWVIALALVIAALAAVIVLAAVVISRGGTPKAAPEDQVRSSIMSYDNAIQTGNLATLRSITCGETRDGYVKYSDTEWAQTYQKVAAAKQYPVVANIDEVVVNGEHAEANVTSFMAFAPQTRSSRSFDLQFRDKEWKICQAD